MRKFFLILLLALFIAAPSLAQTEIRVREAPRADLVAKAVGLVEDLGIAAELLSSQLSTHCESQLMLPKGAAYAAITCVLDDHAAERKIIVVTFQSLASGGSDGNGTVWLFRNGEIVGNSFGSEHWAATIARSEPRSGRYEALFLLDGEYLQMSFQIYS